MALGFGAIGNFEMAKTTVCFWGCNITKACMFLLASILAVQEAYGNDRKRVAPDSSTVSVTDTTLPVMERRVVPDTDDPFLVTYVKVDLRKATVGLAVPIDSAYGASLDRLFQENPALAIVSGGFVDSFAPAVPAGLLVYKGEKLSKEKQDPVLSAIICLKSTKPAVIDIIKFGEEEVKESEYNDCLQVGPMLVLKGKVVDLNSIDTQLGNNGGDPLSQGFTVRAVARSFIGKVDKNTAVLGVTTATNLNALVQFAIRPERENGLGLSDLVGLAGWDAAGLIVGRRRGPPFVAGQTRVRLPNAIVIGN
jgi:hypothetical protein